MREIRKDIPKSERIFSLITSILIGIAFPNTFSFFNGISKGAISFIAFFLSYFIIYFISFCTPKEWVIGGDGIYLPFILKSKIEWNKIKEILERQHGFIVITQGICRKIYLATNEKDRVASIIKSFTILSQ